MNGIETTAADGRRPGDGSDVARIVLIDNVSLDGVIQDPAGDEGFARGGWVGLIKHRPELDQLALDDALGAEALLMGRRTYDWFAARWPSRRAPLAERLNAMPKYVLSSTVDQLAWTTRRCSRGDAARGGLEAEARDRGRHPGPGQRPARPHPARARPRRRAPAEGLPGRARRRPAPLRRDEWHARPPPRGNPDHRWRHRLPALRARAGRPASARRRSAGRRGWRRRSAMTSHRIGTREEWESARAALLAREKEHTRLGDELARERRELPWVRVEKDVPLPDRGRRSIAGRAVRRALPAPRLPLHVRAELPGRLPGQLVDRRLASTASLPICTRATRP